MNGASTPVETSYRCLKCGCKEFVKKWVMPEWMERYRYEIGNTGGNSVEDLMNDHGSNLFNNSIKCLLISSVSSQVNLLERLREKNIIA